MALKHDTGRSRKIPKWPLYILAGIAVVMAIAALIRFMPQSKKTDTSDINKDTPTMEQQGATTEDSQPVEDDYETLLAEVDLLARGYYYDEALALLQCLVK